MGRNAVETILGAMVLAVAAISTTGPLADVAAESPILYSGVPDSAKVVLAATMVLGRLELLALIALPLGCLAGGLGFDRSAKRR